MKQPNYEIQHLEVILRSLLQNFDTRNFVIALHNASVHGEVFDQNESIEDINDQLLGEWFDAIEMLEVVAKKISG